jgi:hypothetical protein
MYALTHMRSPPGGPAFTIDYEARLINSNAAFHVFAEQHIFQCEG